MKEQTPDKLEEVWKAWRQSGNHPSMFGPGLAEAQPIIDKAIMAYAPGSSPSIRSYAKLLVRKAADTFDPKKGTQFKTYLYTQLQPLYREAGAYDTLHIPERVRLDLSALNEKHNQFVDEHGREPSEAELADFTGFSVKRIQHIRRYDRRQMSESVTRPRSDEDAGFTPVAQKDANIWEAFVYDGLSDRDKLIYDLKTGRGKSQRSLTVGEIAVKLKMSPSAISQRLQRISNEIAGGPGGE
jgi:DNA-directed RNA polymerase specialized sigma subunit